MLSIQEINYYTKLVDKDLANPIECPFNEYGVLNHIVVSKVTDEDNVYFKCLTCNSIFTPGLNAEQIIKNTIKKHKIN